MCAFDWKKNRDVAIHLMNYSSKEEYQRSSISRLYYSCFGSSKEYYERAFRRIFSTNNAHNMLINELTNSPFCEEQLLGKLLKTLRSLRNNADYNDKSQDFPVKESKKIVERIFSILNGLNENPIRLIKK